jgi:hypothetical protein
VLSGSTPRLYFPSNDNGITIILDLVHGDVHGPMYIVSLSGYKYYVIFIDEFSRKT